MADILIHSTVPSLFTHTESAADLIVSTSTKDTHINNKYNGHVTRLRNVFTEHSLTSENFNSNEKSFHQTLDDKSIYMTNNREEHIQDIPIQFINNRSFNPISNSNNNENLPYTILNRKYSNSEQHYDFPADAIEQLKKQQRDENVTLNEQIPTRIIPLLLPSNVFKRMDHLNTIFVKPTKIEQSLPKLIFQDDKEQSKLINEADYSQEDNRSSSPIFYEKPGIQELDDNNDEKLNGTRRVRFSNAPIRVYSTYSPSEYDRRNDEIDPFSASAEYELEKRIEKMDVFNVEIEKGPDGLGISVLGMGVGADSGLEKLGIFVKALHPGGVIEKDGRIKVGDQIIEVNNHSLIGVTHAYATNILKTATGLVKFVIGREKDVGKSEILNLIQRSLQLDEEREEMSRTFQQYHDAYYEQNFNDDDTIKDDEKIEAKIPNEFQIEILKQCYESLEKTLDNTEKEKEQYQQLYQQTQNDLKQIEEKYNQTKILIKEFEDREIELRKQQTELNEQHEKHINELMKKIEELEKTIAFSISSKSIECLSNRSRNIIASSLDKISTVSQQDQEIHSISKNNKSSDQLDLEIDQNSLKNKSKINLKNFSLKHLSTPSLGQILYDSNIINNQTNISKIPSLEQTNNDLSTIEYIEIKDWSLDQCIQWLTAQQMTSLIPIFLNRNIDGEKLLLLDSTKMKAMGIKSSKDRDQLKTKIKELKHAELNRLRERLLNQPSSSSLQQPIHSGKRLRSSSLTKLKERKFFTSSSGK